MLVRADYLSETARMIALPFADIAAGVSATPAPLLMNTATAASAADSTAVASTTSWNDSFNDTAFPLPFCNDSCSWTAVFVVSSLLSAVAIAINVCVIVVIRRTPEMRRQPYSVLMINLCASNVLTSLVRGVLSNCDMQTLISYSLPGCYASEITYSVTTFVSLSTITVMSFDRFLGVAYHLRYATTVTPLKYTLFVVAQWVVCIVLGLLPVFKTGISWCVRRFGGCSYSNSGYVIWVHSVVVYMPCALLILFSYIRIWMVIRRLTRAVVSERKERSRGIVTTLIILSAFVLLTLPRLIVALAMYPGAGLGGSPLPDDLGDGLEDGSSLFLSCNALASPIIYSLTNRTFKRRLALSMFSQKPVASGTVQQRPRSNENINRTVQQRPRSNEDSNHEALPAAK